MIPLMMQQGFKAKGWLGLILGRSLWYAFFESAVPTDEKFMQQMDSLIREIGDRGKIETKVSEGVPPRAPALAPVLAKAPAPAAAPAFEPTPEPAPAPRASTPAASGSVPTTPQRALAAVSTPGRGFSPSVQLSPSMPMVQHASSTGGGGSSLTEVASIFENLAARMETRAKEERDAAKADRAELDAKMEQQRQEMEAKMEALKAELTARPAPAITVEQLAALQARIEGLHTTKLLTDEELFALEDLVADYVELTMSVADRVITREMIFAMPVAGKLDKLVGLSAAMAADAAFARQARRKFL